MKCIFCAGHRREPRVMSADEFEILTDRLRGKVRFLYFHLMGEPLMNPSLPLFITRARAKGFIPVVTTNGTLLCGQSSSISQMAAGLAESGPYKVNISLHSHEGNPDAPAMTLDNYLASVAGFAKHAASENVIVVLRLWNNGGYDSENEKIIEILHGYLPDGWTWHDRGAKIADRIFLEYDSMFDWPDYNTEEYGEDVFCYALRNQFGVLVDGSVVPCCLDHDGNMTLGNLFAQPLEEILASERAGRIYDGFTRHKAVEPLCRRCGYALITKQYRLASGSGDKKR